MRTFNLRGLLVTIVICALGVTVEADERKYDIKLAHPSKVGDKYEVTIDGALLQQINSRVGNQESSNSEQGYGIHLEGVVEVLAVNDDGEEAKVACTVKKCVRIAADGEKEFIPAGRVVTAEAGKDKTKFSIDQGDLPENADETLDLALRLADADGDNDDSLYGTKEPQRVGGEWPVAAEAIAQNAAKDDVKMKAEDVKGSLKLEGVEKVNDVDCLKVGGRLDVAKFVPPTPKELGGNFKSETGTMELRFTGFYPVDDKTGSLAESISMNMTGALRRPAGGGEVEAVIRTKTQRSVEMKRRFLTTGAGDKEKHHDD